MVCRSCKLEVPVYASYCPSCGMQVHKPHMHHDIMPATAPAVEDHARHVDWLFEPVYREIEQRLDEVNVDKRELYETAHRIESETLKGDDANLDRLARWFRMLQEVSPDILALSLTALLMPDAGTSKAVREMADHFALQPVL